MRRTAILLALGGCSFKIPAGVGGPDAGPDAGDDDAMIGASRRHAVDRRISRRLIRSRVAPPRAGADADTSQLDQNQLAVRIGMNQEQSGRFWKGEIDEVRTSGGGRDLKWVKAEYITVTDAAFVTVGAPEPY